MCFLTLSTTCPLGFEDSKPDKLHPHLEGCPQAAQPGACPLQTQRTCPAAGMQTGPPGTADCSPWEDGVQSALGPGSWLRLSELTEVYLFIICLG